MTTSSNPSIPSTTRLAPSPTGALHLGNARTFLANWLLARQRGWRIVLRIEDIDGPRIKSEADRQGIDDLAWLGLDWDDGPIYQSSRPDLYRAALDRLLASGVAYACICTRKEVDQAASAPHAEDGASIYPGICRGRFASLAEAQAVAGRPPAVRFAVPAGPLELIDGFAGAHTWNPAVDLGDFVIAKSDGTPAYQLAVVVDDAAMKITHIVRGDDLLDSTPRQILLYRALGLADRIPRYIHLPLVVGPDGRRLAKRHGDTRISAYRGQGISRERLLGLLAGWLGMPGPFAHPREMIGAFDLQRIGREPIVFNAARSPGGGH